MTDRQTDGGRIIDGKKAERYLEDLHKLSPIERKELRKEREKKRRERLEKLHTGKLKGELSAKKNKHEKEVVKEMEKRPYRKLADIYTAEEIETAKAHGISQKILRRRISAGWEPKKALVVPAGRTPSGIAWELEELQIVYSLLRMGKDSYYIAKYIPGRTVQAVESLCNEIMGKERY